MTGHWPIARARELLAAQWPAGQMRKSERRLQPMSAPTIPTGTDVAAVRTDCDVQPLMLALLIVWYHLFDVRLFLGQIMGRA